MNKITTAKTNYTITISGGQIGDIQKNPNGTVTINVYCFDETKPKIETKAGLTFIRIPVHTLSIWDDFLIYTPQNEAESRFKDSVVKILSQNEKIKNFYIPENHSDILFGNLRSCDLHYGNYSCNAWIKNAQDNNWDILKYSSYIMLLAWMLKTLIEKLGWTKTIAYEAICTNSELLQHSKWKEIFGFESLLTSGHRYLLPDDSEDSGCFEAYGGINDSSWKYPLAKISHNHRRDCGKENAPYHAYGFVCIYE